MGEQSWIRRNWPGVLGIVVGLVGLASSYYFYKISQKEREPILLEEPLRSLIVEANSIKNFPLRVVDREGFTLEKDISSMQFYFWNEGRESIKQTDILEPIQVVLASPDVQIIDFKVLSSSRPEIMQPVLNLTAGKNNSLDISFNILEQNDGFVAQILYAGTHNADLKVNGTIEGVKYIQSNSTISSYHFYKSILILMGLPIGGMVIMLLVMALATPKVVKGVLPALGVLLGDIEVRGKFFRTGLVIGIILSMTIASFAVYTQEKGKIEKRADESMLSIVPESIKAIPSNNQLNNDASH